MKVFLDTNVIMEFYGHRTFFDNAKKILSAGIEREIDNNISLGSLYTLTYLFDREMKNQDVHEPEKTKLVPSFLNAVTDTVNLITINKTNIKAAINNEAFHDIEDSYQYQCATANDCDVLVTINLKDFKDAEGNIEVMSPKDFCDKYLE